jgi:hypothetical protein
MTAIAIPATFLNRKEVFSLAMADNLSRLVADQLIMAPATDLRAFGAG